MSFKKRYLASFVAFASTAFLAANSWAQTSSNLSTAMPANTGNQAIQQTFLQVSDDEMAKHWKLSPEEWKHYQDFMSKEGKYFYAHLDPVMVLGIIERDPKRRTTYAARWYQAEAQRLEDQVSFSKLVSKVYQDGGGDGRLMDFASVGYPAAQGFNPDQLMAPISEEAKPAMSPIPAPQADFGAYGETEEFMPGDELWLVIDAKQCHQCQKSMSELLPITQYTPLRIFAIQSDQQQLDQWMQQAVIPPESIRKGAVRASLFAPDLFGSFASQARDMSVFHIRKGKVLRLL